MDMIRTAPSPETRPRQWMVEIGLHILQGWTAGVQTLDANRQRNDVAFGIWVALHAEHLRLPVLDGAWKPPMT
ncbi:hypothetical protein [Ottowia thiooxydans]|uniref:hypothetical protein n=1 Tax=Ottowia thiooxydans TaxID=219182 RepID=UPI0012EC2916|nr:hypothetical protein [Ottowia thiooxydans]